MDTSILAYLYQLCVNTLENLLEAVDDSDSWREKTLFSKRDYWVMIVNCIQWWGSSSEALLPLLPGPLCPEMLATVKVSSMSQIDLFKDYLY